MKKKLLVSLTAMLAIAGLVFAAATGLTADEFNSKYKAGLDWDANSGTITASEFKSLGLALANYDDVQEFLEDNVSVYDGTLLGKKKLNGKWSAAQGVAKSIIETDVEIIPADLKNIATKESDVTALQETLNGWNTAYDECGQSISKPAALTNTLGKIADAIAYAKVYDYVVAVNGVLADPTAANYAANVKKYLDDYEALPKKDHASLKASYDGLNAAAKAIYLNDVKNAFAKFDGLKGLKIVATDLTNPVGDADTHYAILTEMQKSWNILVAGEDGEEDLTVAKTEFADVEIALIKALIAERVAMKEAIDWLNDKNNFYTKTSTDDYKDYAKIVGVRIALAEKEANAAPEYKYITDLYDLTKLSQPAEGETNLYSETKAAYQAQDLKEIAKAEVNTYKTETYAGILVEGYPATAEDYDTEKVKVGGVRAAINEYKALATGWKTTETVNYNNVKNCGANWPADVKTAEAWEELDTDAKKKVAKYMKEGTGDETLANADALDKLYTDKLQDLAKKVAAAYMKADLDAQLTEIWTDGYINPKAENYNPLQLLKLDENGEPVPTIKNGVVTTYTIAPQVSTAYTKIGALANKYRYYEWDNAKDEFIPRASLAAVNTAHADDKEWTKLTTTSYKTYCFGYINVVKAFEASTKVEGVETNPYLVEKNTLTAANSAAGFLKTKKYYDIVYAESVTSENAEDARTTQTAYNKLNAEAKSYLDPIAKQMNENIAAATFDEIAAGVEILKYKSNFTALFGAPNTYYTALTNTTETTSIISLGESITGNELIYVDATYTDEQVELLPANIVVKNEDEEWVANEINIEEGTAEKTWFIPYDVTANTVNFNKEFYYVEGKKIVSPWYLPFDVTIDEINSVFGEDADCKANKLYAVTEEEVVVNGETKNVLNLNWRNAETLYANMPYVVVAPENGFKTISLEGKTLKSTVTARTATKWTMTEGKVDCATTTATFSFSGVSMYKKCAKKNGDDGDYMNSSADGAWRINNNGVAKSGRVILNMKGKTGVNYIIRNKFVNEDDEATVIEGIEIETQPTVEGIYTLNGVKVDNMDKPGLYIVNGKKVIKK